MFQMRFVYKRNIVFLCGLFIAAAVICRSQSLDVDCIFHQNNSRTKCVTGQTCVQLLFSVFFQYCINVVKYDRHGYKPRTRTLVVTDQVKVVVIGMQ